MFEKIYKGMLGAALLCFAIYLVTRIKELTGIGDILIIKDKEIKCVNEYKNHQITKKKKK